MREPRPLTDWQVDIARWFDIPPEMLADIETVEPRWEPESVIPERDNGGVMEIDGATWDACTPAWVARYNACGPAIRRVVLEGGDGMLGGYYAGHEHLMANGSPVLWRDAVDGQRDRLQMEASESAAFAREDEGPF